MSPNNPAGAYGLWSLFAPNDKKLVYHLYFSGDRLFLSLLSKADNLYTDGVHLVGISETLTFVCVLTDLSKSGALLKYRLPMPLRNLEEGV